MATIASPQPQARHTASFQDITNVDSQWTTPQESALLAAIVHNKPVGMHKHFRMIAIRNNLLSTGLINPKDEHTSTAGIWRKLESMYDLKALDEREDAIINDTNSNADDDDASGRDSETGNAGYWRDFELPRDEFEELMWQRRLAPADSTLESSPPATSLNEPAGTSTRRRESTVADTDEPRSSPVSASGRSTRSRPAKGRGGRVTRLVAEHEAEVKSERGSRRSSKAASHVEDEAMEDAGEDEEESGDDEDSEEDEDSKKANASRRGRSAQRGKRKRRG